MSTNCLNIQKNITLSCDGELLINTKKASVTHDAEKKDTHKKQTMQQLNNAVMDLLLCFCLFF